MKTEIDNEKRKRKKKTKTKTESTCAIPSEKELRSNIINSLKTIR